MYLSNDMELAQKGKSMKTKQADHRIPWFGRLLRRTNLDEYPQFINVLLGTMSTVGPRPHMVGEDSVLEKQVARYRIRRFVKPGITGWAAINGLRGGTENLKLIPGDYDVVLSKQKIAHFVNNKAKVEYWIALEADSIFN